ncbi:hypothetical protein CMQ_1432 [Grosmannia clavigera kw1407]|uniref:Uncharacterized protein n=1 Tax=Grosmannia clavigera (strain kw1407 / UAMH 11150) TaxID=655863 RepID=F0XCA2_GROCL|nr:uncharacterized protein CMQ_1432 [Grosmannia clavigera kw1407]EFX04504.1 hypothetical protein CMQ_1432 [Grosmannia clavigera kw1407]
MAAMHPSSSRSQSPARPSSEKQDVQHSHRRGRRLHHGCHSHAEHPRHPPLLPHGAHQLSHCDYAAFQPVFAHYLDLQRRLRLADLSTNETRCRWRSFASRWNRGGLPAAWYRPQMFLYVVRAQVEETAWRQREQVGGNDREPNDESLVHSDDSDNPLDHDSDHSDSTYARPDVLCHDQRAAEHYARLQELLPRISSRDDATAASSADCANYRHVLAALQRQQRRQEAASEMVEREPV